MANKTVDQLTNKTTPIDADYLPLWDSVTSILNKLSWANLKATLKTYFDTLYASAIPQCEWMADTHAGFGGTDTKIPYFTNVNINVDTASAITVVNDSTNGTRITINTAGRYAVGFWQYLSAANYIGISVNSNQLTTNVSTITAAHRRALATSAGADYAIFVGYTGYLAASAVVRPHTNGQGTNTAALCGFSICRVA